MTEQSSNADKDKPAEGASKDDSPTDIGKVTANEAAGIRREGQSNPTDAGKDKNLTIRQRVSETIGKWWEDLKKPEVSNRTVAAATVVIAIATGFTWWEVHTSSRQTDKLVEYARTQAQAAKDMSTAASGFAQSAAGVETHTKDAARAIQQSADTAKQSAEIGTQQTERIIGADERFALAMEQTVTQAQKSFNSTVQQSQVAQRAWLALSVETHLPASGFMEVGKAFGIRIIIRNLGRTPAIHARYSIRNEIIPQDSDIVVKFPSFSSENQQFFEAGTIASENHFFSDTVLTTNLVQGDFDLIMNHRVRIFVFGRVEFNDVFGHPHWNEFCQYLLTGGAFSLCGVHNGEDIAPN